MVSSSRVVRAITLSRVGRVGMEDPQEEFSCDGVVVEQVAVRRINDRRTLNASLRNLLLAYTPAIMKLRRQVLAKPAKAIFVGHISLFWLGLAHQRRWGSTLILSGREMPGGVRTKGSLATWFSRVEPAVLKWASRRRSFTVLAVCDSHADQFRKLGAKSVVVVKNVPPASFSPVFIAPPVGDELIVSCVGSLYPGRGIEALIDGIVEARKQGSTVRLDITGPAGNDYSESLADRIDRAGARAFIAMRGPCPPNQVASRYQESHVGTALYEPVDKANDSLSNKLFESVVAGRPVIAGNLAENRKIVNAYGVGWTTAVDAKSISRLVQDLYKDLGSVRDLAAHCHTVGRQEFTWENEFQALRKVIDGHDLVG